MGPREWRFGVRWRGEGDGTLRDVLGVGPGGGAGLVVGRGAED